MTTSVVVLDRGDYTTCTINLQGATIVSWRFNNKEQLFVAKNTVFNGKSDVMGGIPIVFPQFGEWTFGPLHGFARFVPWEVEKEPEVLPSGDVEATFVMTDTHFTRSMWSNPFKLTYKITLCEKELQQNVTITNLSKNSSIEFNFLFHTYFKVPDLRKSEIIGLQNCSYLDKNKDFEEFKETAESIKVTGPIDRVYSNTPNEHTITNVVSGHKMRLVKNNLPNTVVWNPWDKEAKKFGFEPDEYLNMICVEAGHVSKYIKLQPEENYEVGQVLQIIEPPKNISFDPFIY